MEKNLQNETKGTKPKRKRCATLSMSVTEETKRKIMENADKYGMTMTEYVTYACETVADNIEIHKKLNRIINHLEGKGVKK